MLRSRPTLAAMLLWVCSGFVTTGTVTATDQQSEAVVSKALSKPLKAAIDAIARAQYDVALADVHEAQGVPMKRSAYDNYVIDNLLFEIYVGKSNTDKAISMLDSVAQSKYASNDWLRDSYLALARYEYKLGLYDKTLDAVRIAMLHGATKDQTADLIASATRSRESELRWRKSARISALRPSRRDSPLRNLNISDDEVRESQAAVATQPPFEFVSINGVVTGCPMEEGPACTDQVWVELRRRGKGTGLQLSRVNKRWIVGVVQQWYLCDEALDARRDSFSTYFDYMAAKEALVENFPSCDTQSVPLQQP